jgi:hypothetical protein
MDILVINKKNYPSLSDRDLEVFYETGILRFAGALRDDPVFHTFLRDLTWTARRLLKRANVEVQFNASLALMLPMLLKAEGGALPRFLNGLCSHPMKLMSGNLLKCDPRLMFVLRKLMGEDAVIASPTMSDSILFNIATDLLPSAVDGAPHQSLPIHQDYPYMMQSDRQLVVWIPLVEYNHQLGGFHCWLGSHKDGPAPQTKKGDYYALEESGASLDKRFERHFVDWQLGDVVVFDSLLVHQTVRNTHPTETRIIQMFRFSDLNSQTAEEYFWRSTAYVDRSKTNRKAISLEDIRPDLVTVF